MKKKVLSVLLAAAMVMSLAACGSGGDGSGDSGNDGSSGGGKYDGVELTYWSMWNSPEPQGQALQEAVDAWEAETGATVNIEWKGRDVKDILSSSLEAKEKIDLFEDDYNRISVNLKGYVADLTDMAEAAGYADKSFAVFNGKATEWAGFLSCITEQPQVGGVYYNQDLFDQVGAAVPTNWTEFLDVCQKLKDGGIQPIALDSAYAAFFYGYHLSRYVGEDTVAELAEKGGWGANPGVVQSAQDMIDLKAAGYLADGAPSEYPAGQNAIGLDQDVAMVVCANYVTAEVNNNAQVELNWGVFNYPSVEGGIDAAGVAYAGANSIAITNYSENQQAAFDLALYIATGDRDQNMADKANQIPADPGNTAPSSQNGTIELLNSTTTPLTWNMGLNQNADLQPSIREIVIQLYEGKFATGEDFAAALDALY